MTTYKITNIDITSFNSYIKKIVVDTNEITIQVDDSYTTFEEREELIGEKMCEVLGLSELEYSVNCTYQFISSDCSDTWKEEDEE